MNKMKTLIISIGIPAFFLFQPLHAQPTYKLAEQDSLALVAFYWATDGPNWFSNTEEGFGHHNLTSEWQDQYFGGYNRWLEGPARDWFGVTVENMPIPGTDTSAYRVTRIWPVLGRRSEGQNWLSGYVPREMALLTELRRLWVQGNSGFDSTELPEELFHKTLRYLSIESCNFTGGIPDAFRNCTNMRKMDIRYNTIDYMPVLDFLDADALYSLDGIQWFYNTSIPLATFEKIIDYFYTVSPNPKEFPIEMRNLNNMGDEMEIVAPLGSSVVMECTAAGEREEYITYQWFKDGMSRIGRTQKTYSIADVKSTDYGNYTVRVTNDYVKAYDQNESYGEMFTKPIRLVPEPVPPVVQRAKTSYNGKEIILRMSKPMNPQVSGYETFAINDGAGILTVTAARTGGRLDRDLILTLNEPLYPQEEAVTIDYAGSGIVDKNGGVLAPFADMAVTNMVREEPVLVSAQTTRDGSGIEVFFDKFIDEHSIDQSDFAITGDKDHVVIIATLLPGEIDRHISKGVLLNLSEPIADSSEVLTLEYSQGGLSGFLSGVVKSSGVVDVTNRVLVERTDVVFHFEDGTRSLTNILIDPNWQLGLIEMFDDGTHGDSLENDHVWTATVSLVDGDYRWDVLSRRTVASYDTTWYTDPVTGVTTLTVTPVEKVVDSLLNQNILLQFSVQDESVSGTTSFGIKNKTVVFNVTLGHASDDVFLMGIGDDWVGGIHMQEGENFTYSVSVPGYTIQDVIKYNYRDDSFWENKTPAQRSYTVKTGENIINDQFGVVTLVERTRQDEVRVFPNPASTFLNVDGLGNWYSLEVFNFSGQLIHACLLSGEERVIVDVSGWQGGMYLLKINSKQGSSYTFRFIKL